MGVPQFPSMESADVQKRIKYLVDAGMSYEQAANAVLASGNAGGDKADSLALGTASEALSKTSKKPGLGAILPLLAGLALAGSAGANGGGSGGQAPATPMAGSGGGETQDLTGMITQTAQKYGVDPQLALQMAKAESNLNPAAVSKAGAQGLFQLMPGTASDMGVQNVMDPAQNADGGLKYMAGLLNKYNGDTNTALAAYNFGPGNVDSGKPYPAETTNYIDKITGGMGQQQPQGQSPLASMDWQKMADSMLQQPQAQQPPVQQQTANSYADQGPGASPLVGQEADPQTAMRAAKYGGGAGAMGAGIASQALGGLAGPLGSAAIGGVSALLGGMLGGNGQEEMAKQQMQQDKRNRLIGSVGNLAQAIEQKNKDYQRQLMILAGYGA